MTLRRLVFREITHNHIGFIVGMVAVIVAAGVLTAELSLLRAHDLATAEILAAKEREIAGEMARMEDDYRKIMKELGFNLLILPENQRLDNFYDAGYASLYMPEEYVTRLSESDIVSIRHLLPSIESKVRWTEQGSRTIILIGTRGEVPFVRRSPKEPMLFAVPPGKIVLGYELWNSLGLDPGDSLDLLGRRFTVETCHPQRGTKDDITAWVDLAMAQTMLGKEGLVNGILALKCHCSGNEIATVRKDIARILPDVQIIQIENKVVTRAKARDRARATADSALAAEKVYRATIRAEQESFAALIVPLVILGSIALVGFLAFSNVRERRAEIGILRAIGFKSRQILGVFLGKAVVLGFVGAILGYCAGFGITVSLSDVLAAGATALFDIRVLVLMLACAPFLSALASWAPALMAARQDPADILSEE